MEKLEISEVMESMLSDVFKSQMKRAFSQASRESILHSYHSGTGEALHNMAEFNHVFENYLPEEYRDEFKQAMNSFKMGIASLLHLSDRIADTESVSTPAQSAQKSVIWH